MTIPTPHPAVPISRPSTPGSLTSNNNSISRLSPSLSLNLRVGKASPDLVIERFHLIQKKSHIHAHTPSSRRRTTPNETDQSFQMELQNAALPFTENVGPISSILNNDNIPPLSTNNTFSWKTALSVVALLSIGGGIASTFFLVAAPELLLRPPAAKSLLLRYVFTSLLSTKLSPPTSTCVYIQTFGATLRDKILPAALPALKKMATMEIWRKIWTWTFRSLKELYETVFRGSYSDSIWTTYVPSFVTKGVKKMVTMLAQRKVEGFVGGLWAWNWSGWYWDDSKGDFQDVGDGSGDGLVLLAQRKVEGFVGGLWAWNWSGWYWNDLKGYFQHVGDGSGDGLVLSS